MKPLLLAVLLAGAVFLPACSSTSGICEAIKAGQDPVVASGASYSAMGGSQKREQAAKLQDAAEEVRSSCPEQDNAAKRLEGVADALGV